MTEKSTVDVYDSYGNRTTGNALSGIKSSMTAFTNGGKGYVCGGATYIALSSVDIYYDEETTTYEAKIPITAGTSYTLNGTSGTASSSQVLTFNEKVSGTVEYKKGEIPS